MKSHKCLHGDQYFNSGIVLCKEKNITLGHDECVCVCVCAALPHSSVSEENNYMV